MRWVILIKGERDGRGEEGMIRIFGSIKQDTNSEQVSEIEF
jgi:hypothetical protein